MADNYRYPGPSSFSFEQRSVFFGRDEDISNMRTSVIVNPTTVLFGKSGTGKSSLIQAGLLPKLLDATEKNSKVSPYLIIDVMPKPFEKGKNLWEEVKNIISKKIEPDYEFLKITGLQNSSSLWYLLKGLQYTHYVKKINQTVLLIFDQCEELFTYPDSQIDKFVQELYPVIGQFIPEQFQKIISTKKTTLSSDELKVLFEPLFIKFLFSIRSDKLHLITRLKKASTNILQNSYELLPLTKQSAFEAIDKPSQADGDFISKEKFTVTDEAKEYIFKELSAQQNEPEDYFEEARIDPFSLQIICQYIERNIVPDTTVVTEYFGFPEEIIKGYYLSSINKLKGNDDEKVKVKNFIELRLLQNNRRIPIHEDLITADEKYPVSKEILRELVDFRILKKDISVSGGLMYEITHDCFIAPINEAKEERLGKTYEYKSSETINDLLKQIQQKENSATIIRSAAGAQEANEKQQAGMMSLASSADSNLSDLYKKLGDAYVVVQDYRQAIDAFSKAIGSEISNQNNTSLIEVYRARANAYYSISDFVNSDKDLEKIVQINPDDYLAVYTLAQNKRDETNYDESTKYYEKAIELNPSNIGIYNDIGNNYYYDKNYEKAKEYYQKTVDKNPDADYAWYNLGLVEETLKNTTEALKYYDAAVKLNPSSNTFNTIGNIYFGIKDYDNAQNNYEEALKIDNTFFYATYNIGLIEENRGNLDSALEYYNKALDINPTYENAFIGRANVNYKKEDFEAARKDYLKLIELYPNEASYYYELAGIEQTLKDWNAVIDKYKKVMELDPTYKNDIANNDTGLAYFNLQDWENAEKYFVKALEIEPGNYLYLNNVSAVKLNLGDFDAAEEYVKRSIKVKPDYALSYYNYGNIYESRGNSAEAIIYYKKCLELNPDYTKAKEHLEALEKVKT